MAYTKQTWEARTGVGLNKFTDTNTGSTLVLTSTPDSITNEGTPFTADRMNHMEEGIENAHSAISDLNTAVAEKAPSSHTHGATDIVDVLSVLKGGTYNSALADVTDGAIIIKRTDDGGNAYLGISDTTAIKTTARESISAASLGNNTFTGVQKISANGGTASFQMESTVSDVVYKTAFYLNSSGNTIITHTTNGTSDNYMVLAPTYSYFEKPITIKSGGTGANTATDARTNLNAASLGANYFTGSQGINDSSSQGIGFYVRRTIDSI